jgi:hypothetical protein
MSQPFAWSLLLSLSLGTAALAEEPETSSAAVPASPSPIWGEAFPVASLSSHLEAKVPYLVVAAGPVDSGSKAAAVALVQALRATGQTSLVMTGEALGDVSALDDPAIAGKAKGLPVELVSIVRVFPGADGQPFTAVVTNYRRQDGTLAHAWSASPAAPLVAKAAAEAGSSGVQAKAAEKVAEIAKESARSVAVSQEEYEQKYIGYDDYMLMNGNGAAVGNFTQFHQGKFKKPLDVPELFTLVGRHDLRTRYDDAFTTKWVLLGGGFAAMVFSPLATIGGGTERLPAMLGLVLGGTVLMTIGLFVNPNPIPAHEVRALADAYNRKLKGEDTAVADDAVSTLLRDVNVGVAPLPGGAVAAVSGRF